MKPFLFYISMLLLSFFLGTSLWAQVLTPRTGFNVIECGNDTRLCDSGGCSSNYLTNSNGYTIIRATGDAQITFTGNFSVEGYPYDFLIIYDGIGTNGTMLYHSNTAGTGNLTYTAAPGQSITIQLVTDGSVQYSGFNFNISFTGNCAPITTLPENGSIDFACGTNAIITDFGGVANNYTANNNSIAQMHSSNGAFINIYGNYYLGAGDTISIYSGIGTTGTLLSNFTGTGLLNFTGGMGESLTLQLRTNESTHAQGIDFLLSYNGLCTCPTVDYAGDLEICVGDTTNIVLTANIPNNGYNVSNITYAPLTCPSGATVVTGDDMVTSPINLPFTFKFFGQDFTQVGISTNGNIQLGAGPYNDAFTSIGPIPSTNVRNMIALNYSDWVVTTTNASITYQTVGVAPNRIFQVCFNNLTPFGQNSTGNLTGQILLYETTNIVEMHITQNTMPAIYNNQTQGLQHSTGVGVGYLGRNFSYWTASNSAVRFDPNLNFTWSPLSNGINVIDNNNISFTSSTIGSFNYINNYQFGYCTPQADTLVFQVNDVSAIYEQTNVLCNGNATGHIDYISGVGNNFSWSTGATSQNLENITAGTYTVTVSNGNCHYTETFTITEPTPFMVTLDSMKQLSCNMQDGLLSVTAFGGQTPYTYAWSTGATVAHIENLAAGTYTLTVTDGNDCVQTLSQNLVESGITASLVSLVDSICFAANTGSATIDVLPSDATVTWSTGATGLNINSLAAGTYTATATLVSGNNVCEEVISFTIHEPSDALQVGINIIQDIDCIYERGELLAMANGGWGDYTYVWSNAINTASNVDLQAGTYIVTITDALGCQTIGSSIINPLSMPNLNAYIGQSGVKNIEVSPATLVNFAAELSDPTLDTLWSYIWTPIGHNHTPNNPNQSNVNIEIQEPGEYYFALTSQYGNCVLHDTLKILVQAGDFELPTAFSPNNDGENDVFRPVNFNTNYLKSFRVFNRWGQTIYESAVEPTWDGTYNNEPQPRDVYMYVIEYQMPQDNGVQIKKGQFTLIR